MMCSRFRKLFALYLVFFTRDCAHVNAKSSSETEIDEVTDFLEDSLLLNDTISAADNASDHLHIAASDTGLKPLSLDSFQQVQLYSANVSRVCDKFIEQYRSAIEARSTDHDEADTSEGNDVKDVKNATSEHVEPLPPFPSEDYFATTEEKMTELGVNSTVISNYTSIHVSLPLVCIHPEPLILSNYSLTKVYHINITHLCPLDEPDFIVTTKAPKTTTSTPMTTESTTAPTASTATTSGSADMVKTTTPNGTAILVEVYKRSVTDDILRTVSGSPNGVITRGSSATIQPSSSTSSPMTRTSGTPPAGGTTLEAPVSTTPTPPVTTSSSATTVKPTPFTPAAIYHLKKIPLNQTIVINASTLRQNADLDMDPLLLFRHSSIIVHQGVICTELSKNLCGEEVKPLSFFGPYIGDDKKPITAGIDCRSLNVSLSEIKKTVQNDSEVGKVFQKVKTGGSKEEKDSKPGRAFGGSHLKGFLQDIKYDSRTSPAIIEGEHIEVKTRVHIESISNFQASTMDFEVDLYLEMAWRDFRLFNIPFEPYVLVFEQELLDMLWLPDPYFSNSKESTFHTVTRKNQMVQVYKGGLMYYAVRVHLTPTCNLFLCKFPHDKQQCELTIRSFSYPTNVMQFTWNEDKSISINPKMAFADMYVKKMETTTCDVHPAITGNTTCARVIFYLERESGFFVAQIYIPTTITLMFSWISVWLPVEFLEGRIGVAITVLLIVATESNGARTNLPFVSYTKAIDLWLGFIKGFVFSTLIQTLFVLGLARKAAVLERWSRKKTFSREERDELEDRSEFFFQAAQKLDLCCRLLYPLTFCIFLGYYFGIFINGSQASCLSSSKHNLSY